jgi:hypothetical protein
MNWKALVLILLIAAVAGMIGFTYYFGGPNYMQILGKPFGDVTSFITKVVFRTNERPFNVLFEADRGYFNSMSFQVVNSTVKVEGDVAYMKIDSTTVNKVDKVVIGNLNGDVSISDTGIVTVKGNTLSIAVNDVFFSSSGKELAVEVAFTPGKMFVSSISENKITFPAVTGKLTVEGKTSTISNLEAASLALQSFQGSLVFDETAELSGVVTKATVNGEDISVTLQ